ncbi:MAG: FHA domain-containing protein [Woeseiaceae bacterium]|nr:FHA domain-containing protein [Woeseiaceae bacterium]
MNSQTPTLARKAFGHDAEGGLVIAGESCQSALRFLVTALQQDNGVALLQGPRGSGKTTIVREQASWWQRDVPVAVFDGKKSATRELVSGMLAQYGVDVIPQEDEQMLQTLGNFLSQKAESGRAPILIIDNADRLGSSTLSLLNWLADLDVRGRWSLRIVLTGTERLAELASKHSMRNLERRHPAVFTMNPLSLREAVAYLRTRFVMAGGEKPEELFPVDVCERLHELARGWPGRINDFALEAMVRMEELQDTREMPRIIVTRDGNTLAEYSLSKRECIIGRDKMADIVIEDKYVSKLHAMLQLYNNGVVLLDLNSTNGTLVNSVETKKAVLRNNDIISLGSHRLKIENAPAISDDMAEKIRRADTLTLKNLDELRRSRARHNIVALKHRQ